MNAKRILWTAMCGLLLLGGPAAAQLLNWKELDGKLATRAGDSQWISSEASRAVVHQLRGRVDEWQAILEHVERRVALPGERPLAPLEASREIFEQLANVVGQVGRLAGGKEGELGHQGVP